MNELLRKLRGGDLRSDGRANEVAEEVMGNPQLLPVLVEGLAEPDDVVRARTAHALENISRVHPEFLQDFTPQLRELALKDEVPMVRWHIAMIFGNTTGKEVDDVVSVLFHLLEDESVFVVSWSIVSLCILGGKYESKRREIIEKVEALKDFNSIAIRTKVKKAINVLKGKEPMPVTWYKGR